MKNILCSFVLIILVINLSAQKRFDLFYLGGNYNFNSPTEVIKNNYEASIQSNLSVPLFFKDSSIWFTSVDYQYFSTPSENFILTPKFPGELSHFNLHGIILRTGYVRKLSQNQALHFLLAPRLMGDFSSSLRESLQLGGIVMYEKVRDEDFTWRAGLMFNNEFFGPYVLPVVYLDWKIAGKIKITGLLPVYGKLYSQVSENLSAGLHFIGLTTSYRVNAYDSDDYYVDRRSVDVSLFANRYLFANISCELRAGFSLLKDYGLYRSDDKITLGIPLVNIGDNRIRNNGEYAGSPFVHLRAVYGIPMK